MNLPERIRHMSGLRSGYEHVVTGKQTFTGTLRESAVPPVAYPGEAEKRWILKM